MPITPRYAIATRLHFRFFLCTLAAEEHHISVANRSGLTGGHTDGEMKT